MLKEKYSENNMPPKQGTKRKLNTKRESDDQKRCREEREETERKKMKLIELVRQHEVLYNTAHPDHLNTSITDVLWEEITAILEEGGKFIHCK